MAGAFRHRLITIAAASVAAFSSIPVAAQSAADPDAVCLIAISAASENVSKEDEAGFSAITMFFTGELAARYPDQAVLTAALRAAAETSAADDFVPPLKACVDRFEKDAKRVTAALDEISR